jgi:halimadienyl-diphosphate synthase
MDPRLEVKELVHDLRGRMGPSAYDMAWMARIPSNNGGALRWPGLIDWLLEHQWPDGSFGGTIPYYHDRIISTLSSIIALSQGGTGKGAEAAVKRGERYIWHNLHRLRNDPYELVGFELILPTLLMEALDLGLDVPVHTCGYGRIRREKLALIPPPMVYSPRVTTVHSLEFLGKEGIPARLSQAVAANGSLGNSPATTSYYLLRAGHDERAVDYLEGMLASNDQVVYLYPCRTFQLTWVLHSLSYGSQPLIDLVNGGTWGVLQASLSPRGIGLDATFGIEDGDITSVTVRLLKLAGYPVDAGILAQYEDKARRVFRTYHYERNISVSTNVHALEALAVLPEYPERQEVMDRILAFLLAQREFDTYWTDKWNASPYYVTAHALVALLDVFPEVIDECRYTVQWLVHTQRPDGSWGFYDRGTLEETAYALTALLHYHRRRPEAVSQGVLEKAAEYLYQNYAGSNTCFPELYIGKCLFTPRDVVRATVLAAMILYEEDFQTQ